MSIAELLSGVCKFNVDGAYSFNVVGIDRKFNKSNKNYFILDAILKPEGISLNDAKMASVSPYFLYETFVPSYISIKNMMDVMIGVRFVIYKASFDVFMSIGSDTCKSYIAIEKYMHDLIPFLNLPCFVTVPVE